MEQFDLTIPDQVNAGTSIYRIASVALNWENKTMTIVLTAPGGFRKTIQYVDPQATTMMRAINKANLSTKSLHKRLLEQLATDGELIGAISGLPD